MVGRQYWANIKIIFILWPNFDSFVILGPEGAYGLEEIIAKIIVIKNYRFLDQTFSHTKDHTFFQGETNGKILKNIKGFKYVCVQDCCVTFNRICWSTEFVELKVIPVYYLHKVDKLAK